MSMTRGIKLRIIQSFQNLSFTKWSKVIFKVVFLSEQIWEASIWTYFPPQSTAKGSKILTSMLWLPVIWKESSPKILLLTLVGMKGTFYEEQPTSCVWPDLNHFCDMPCLVIVFIASCFWHLAHRLLYSAKTRTPLSTSALKHIKSNGWLL